MLKTDINLLPKKKKIPVSVTFGVPLALLFFALIVTIGILLPRMALNAQQTKLNSLEKDLTAYSNVETAYSQAVEEYAKIQNQQKTYKDFTESKYLTLDLINKINLVKPKTITLLDLNFDSEMISISGFATSDIEIAKFEVELRKLAIFSEINLGGIEGPDDKRTFSFSLMHIIVETSSIGGASK